MQVTFRLFLSILRQRFGRALLASVVLPASLSSPSAHGTGKIFMSSLSLPPHARVSEDADFGRGPKGGYYFYSPSGGNRLFRLSVIHPMGARDLWRETWTSVELPSFPGFRVRSAAIGEGHLFLGGGRRGGGAVVRSFQIGHVEEGGKERMVLRGQVDYFPEAADVAVRILFLDRKAGILWLAYDSGRVESGTPFLFLHDRILWADPAGYIPLPRETSLASGPPPLLVPRATRSSGLPCFSCRFTLTLRTVSPHGEIRNIPVRAPERVGSAMGILPAGSGMGFFEGRLPHICRIPEKGEKAELTSCHRTVGPVRPVSAAWWGNRLAYLFPPGGIDKGMDDRWVVATLNPARIFSSIEKLKPGEPFDFVRLIREKGAMVPLPAGAHPRLETMSEDGKDLVLFGASHLYRISMAS